MKLAYYPGCSGQGTSAEYERSTRAVCRALEIGLKEISDWSCCGSTPATLAITCSPPRFPRATSRLPPPKAPNAWHALPELPRH